MIFLNRFLKALNLRTQTVAHSLVPLGEIYRKVKYDIKIRRLY